MKRFKIDIDRFEHEDSSGIDFVYMKMIVSGNIVTKNVNIFTADENDFIKVPVDKVCNWFLDNFWRFLYEPYKAERDWIVSHCFSWMDSENRDLPALFFLADCDSHIEFSSIAGLRGEYKFPIGFTETLYSSEFRNEVLEFVKNCLKLMENKDITFKLERIENDLSSDNKLVLRKIEALLGLKPSEDPIQGIIYKLKEIDYMKGVRNEDR